MQLGANWELRRYLGFIFLISVRVTFILNTRKLRVFNVFYTFCDEFGLLGTSHFGYNINIKTYSNTFSCPVGQPMVNFWLPDRKKWLPLATGQPVMWNPLGVRKLLFKSFKKKESILS